MMRSPRTALSLGQPPKVWSPDIHRDPSVTIRSEWARCRTAERHPASVRYCRDSQRPDDRPRLGSSDLGSRFQCEGKKGKRHRGRSSPTLTADFVLNGGTATGPPASPSRPGPCPPWCPCCAGCGRCPHRRLGALKGDMVLVDQTFGASRSGHVESVPVALAPLHVRGGAAVPGKLGAVTGGPGSVGLRV